MRLYQVRMVRAGVIAEFAYECYDEGEPKEGIAWSSNQTKRCANGHRSGLIRRTRTPDCYGQGWRQPEL